MRPEQPAAAFLTAPGPLAPITRLNHVEGDLAAADKAARLGLVSAVPPLAFSAGREAHRDRFSDTLFDTLFGNAKC